jgi:hypothetical protein
VDDWIRFFNLVWNWVIDLNVNWILHNFLNWIWFVNMDNLLDWVVNGLEKGKALIAGSGWKMFLSSHLLNWVWFWDFDFDWELNFFHHWIWFWNCECKKFPN